MSSYGPEKGCKMAIVIGNIFTFAGRGQKDGGRKAHRVKHEKYTRPRPTALRILKGNPRETGF